MITTIPKARHRKRTLRSVPRGMSHQRLRFLVTQMMDQAHVVGHAPVRRTMHGKARSETFILLSLDDDDFDDLCALGAEVEDFEENGDLEPNTDDEPDDNPHCGDAPVSTTTLSGYHPTFNRDWSVTNLFERSGLIGSEAAE